MKNSVLHLLTNRASGFGNVIFPENDDYEPHVETEEETTLRSFLRLDSTSSPTHLVSIMSSIYSFPEILEEFQESERTFDLGDYRKEPDVVHNAALVTALDKTASLRWVPLEYPHPTSMTIQHAEGNVVQIIYGTTRTYLPCQLRVGNLLDVEWPASWGISGLLDIGSGVWDANSIITITHYTPYFPYALCADKVMSTSSFFKFLNDKEAVKHIHTAQSAVEKVAHIALALCSPSLYAS
jgi:hypothetical protein